MYKYTAQKIKRMLWKHIRSQLDKEKKIILHIYTDMYWVMWYEWKDTTSFDGKENDQPIKGWNQREKMMWQANPFCQNFIVAAKNFIVAAKNGTQ